MHGNVSLNNSVGCILPLMQWWNWYVINEWHKFVTYWILQFYISDCNLIFNENIYLFFFKRCTFYFPNLIFNLYKYLSFFIFCFPCLPDMLCVCKLIFCMFLYWCVEKFHCTVFHEIMSILCLWSTEWNLAFKNYFLV